MTLKSKSGIRKKFGRKFHRPGLAKKNLFMVCQQQNTLGFMNTCCVRFPKSIMDHLHARESRFLYVSYFLLSLKLELKHDK